MYVLISRKLVVEGRVYRTYGIRNEAVMITDVTSDCTVMCALVELCNRCRLASDQLYDVIEDFCATAPAYYLEALAQMQLHEAG